MLSCFEGRQQVEKCSLLVVLKYGEENTVSLPTLQERKLIKGLPSLMDLPATLSFIDQIIEGFSDYLGKHREDLAFLICF